MAKLKVEACNWIDDLEESLCNLFSTKEREKITTGSRITHSHKAIVPANAQEAATAYEKYFKSQNDPITTEDDLIDIFQHTEAVKQAYQNEKVYLQQLHNTTLALQKDTTVQDNLAMLCKQNDAISKKTDELEAWKKQFDIAQENCFKESEKKMKKQFKKWEERINEKFKDISTTMEKNQETIMTAIQSKNSVVQEQINQLVQSVMVLGNSMKKHQGQVDSLRKHDEDKSDQLDGVKHACWGSNNVYN
eukprot:15123407-Ditylum_brightwellii.AAC.1